ncbi:MAG TPA: lantibiotic dehydratase [Pyrinomonadaceae bacterium]|nr:lantibiotic dehydratase [Pyrinomonadaceae bacterium]
MQATRSLNRAEVAQVETPEHLFQLGHPKWALWRCVCLRSAGFPADGVLRLSAPSAAAPADLLLAAETDLEQARAAANALLDSELDRLRREESWDANKPYRRWLLDELRMLKAGKIPDLEKGPFARGQSQSPVAEMNEVFERVRCAAEQLHATRSKFEREYAAGVKDVSRALRELAEDERFREAIAWQNRDVLHAGVDSLLRHYLETGSRDSAQRQNEEVIASYWQRYCVKNDTIGFFGPVGWARLVDDAAAFEARPGKSLLAARTVYFEQWGIDALIDLINKDTATAMWALPRRLPAVRLEGDWLHVSFRRPQRLPPKQVAVLRACDGTRTAAEVAADVRRGGGDWRSDAEVFTILKGLKAQGLIAWHFEAPLSAYPERRLRELLERVEDEDVRSRALALLEEFEACRERVAAAAGDSQRLDTAFRELEHHFTNVTDQAATRCAGRMYTGRTLVYEDCRRDIDLEIGSDFVEELSGPLVLLLQSARWFMNEAGVRLRCAFREIYEQLSLKSGSRMVDAAAFRMEVQGTLFSGNSSVFDEVQEEFRRRWASVLAISPEQNRVTYRCDDLRPAVDAAFAAPRAGWTAALHHSPDLMIAAESVDAIRRGEYEIILGELHLAAITIGGSVFYQQHPAKLELLRAKESDIPAPQPIPVIPNSWLPTRVFNSLDSKKDYYIEFTPESFVAERERVLLIADFVVEEQQGELVARTRNGRLCFDVLEVFGRTFSYFITERFRMFGDLSHTPRVSIDRVTVTRETWRCAARELEFAHVKDEAERFLATRRWARSLGMPRQVFVKVPIETKPCYVDFDSPVYVNLLAKLMRRTAEKGGPEMQAVFTEMLPDVEQSWLPDADGRRYTCELRMVALDQAR